MTASSEAQTAAAGYGGFWRRLAAGIVDACLVFVAWFLIVPFAIAGGDTRMAPVLAVVIPLAYHTLGLRSAGMATPGKRVLALYVTDLEGRRLTFGKAFMRQLAVVLSLLTLGAGFAMAAFSPRKQALHDRIAGTLVHYRGKAMAALIGTYATAVLCGALAAVAIPVFQDNVIRSQTSSIVSVMAGQRDSITSYMMDNGKWPTTWEQLGANPTQQLSPGDHRLTQAITLGPDGAIVAELSIHGKTGKLRMVPTRSGDTINWTCSSDPDISRHVPGACR